MKAQDPKANQLPAIDRVIKALSVGVALTLGGATKADALTFNLTYDSSLTGYANLSQIQTAANKVATEFSSLYSNTATVNIKIAGITTGLGQSDTSLGVYTYGQIKTQLDPILTASGISTLPTTDPTGGGNFAVARAEAKALGLLSATDATLDGTFSFNTTQAYTFDRSGGIASGTEDFMGVAEHEFSEIMGRIAGFTSGSTYYNTPFDLFRYTAPGVRNIGQGQVGSGTELVSATNVYFSIDNGTTAAKYFNNSGNGGDVSDWASGTNDAFNAFSFTGVQNDMTADYNVKAMNAVGWRRQAPEPSTWIGTLVFGAFGIKTVCKRRQKIADLTDRDR